MSLYWIFFLGAAFLVVLAITGYFYFVNWIDRRIDKRDRLGRDSIVKNDTMKKHENGDDEVERLD